MNALQIVEKIRQAGGLIAADGDELIVQAPAGLLSQSDRDTLRDNKPDLLIILPSSKPEPATDRRGQIRAMLDRVAAAWPEGYAIDPDAERWDEAANAIDEALASNDEQQFTRTLEAYEAMAEGLYERFAIMHEGGDTSFDVETFERLERRATQIKNQCKRKGLPTIDDADFRFVGLLDRWQT
jgi:hypothetical protein